MLVIITGRRAHKTSSYILYLHHRAEVGDSTSPPPRDEGPNDMEGVGELLSPLMNTSMYL